MRVSFALIASAIVASLAAAAPSSIESESSNAMINRQVKFPAKKSVDSVIVLRDRDDQNVYFSGLRQRESDALSGIVSEFRNIFAKGSFDYVGFANKTNEWSEKLSEIEKNVKEKLPGEYNLDSVLEFIKRQFYYMKEAGEYQDFYKNKNILGSDFVVDVLEMRAKIGSFYSSDGTISSSIKDVDAQIEQLSINFSGLSNDFEDVQDDMVIQIRDLYTEQRKNVTKALQELKQKATERKSTEETCGERARFSVAGPR